MYLQKQTTSDQVIFWHDVSKQCGRHARIFIKPYEVVTKNFYAVRIYA